jgi:Biotin-lipoyl like
VRVVDNQYVHKGDVLYTIDAFDFEVARRTGAATARKRAADLQVTEVQSARRQRLTDLATTPEATPFRPGPRSTPRNSNSLKLRSISEDQGSQSCQRLCHQPVDAAPTDRPMSIRYTWVQLAQGVPVRFSIDKYRRACRSFPV